MICSWIGRLRLRLRLRLSLSLSPQPRLKLEQTLQRPVLWRRRLRRVRPIAATRAAPSRLQTPLTPRPPRQCAAPWLLQARSAARDARAFSTASSHTPRPPPAVRRCVPLRAIGGFERRGCVRVALRPQQVAAALIAHGADVDAQTECQQLSASHRLSARHPP